VWIYNLNLFTGKIRDLLSKAVTFTLIDPLFDEFSNYSPVIRGNSLSLFHRKTLQSTRYTLNQTVDLGTAYCYIQSGIDLCFGGTTHNQVFEVNVKNGTVMRASSMHQNRLYAGIFNLNGKWVLIFGGKGPISLNRIWPENTIFPATHSLFPASTGVMPTSLFTKSSPLATSQLKSFLRESQSECSSNTTEGDIFTGPFGSCSGFNLGVTPKSRERSSR